MGLQKEQKNMAAEHLIDCDLKFPNLEDTCPRLPITLIFSYKRNKHTKKMGTVNQEQKPKVNKDKTEFKSKN